MHVAAVCTCMDGDMACTQSVLQLQAHLHVQARQEGQVWQVQARRHREQRNLELAQAVDGGEQQVQDTAARRGQGGS